MSPSSTASQVFTLVYIIVGIIVVFSRSSAAPTPTRETDAKRTPHGKPTQEPSPSAFRAASHRAPPAAVSAVAGLVTSTTQPVIDWVRALLEWLLPEDEIDINGNGLADFKVCNGM